MKMWVGKLCAVTFVCLIFLGAGLMIGAKRPSARFERISDIEAFDTKTGQKCRTVSVQDPDRPPGWSNSPEGLCADISKQ